MMALEVGGFFQHWGMHLTGGGGALTLAVLFRDFILEAGKGFAGKMGEKWQAIGDKWWNRRKKSRRGADVTIGALQQQVKDLMGFKKETVKRLSKTEARLEMCQAERTECRADLKNLLFRVSALERSKR